ncbi:hypothetical protein K1T71_000173 [Dendrolimus kikuchii]|uniref:Uncharacterized protein n=1 Tax=Dendrolimus kikuchii TaxID=765133 RepID=A0ACC1DIM0_9NEOP|nr:hypothetical protein K1T71_000173 [Dendrolimus kikuchii]
MPWCTAPVQLCEMECDADIADSSLKKHATFWYAMKASTAFNRPVLLKLNMAVIQQTSMAKTRKSHHQPVKLHSI